MGSLFLLLAFESASSGDDASSWQDCMIALPLSFSLCLHLGLVGVGRERRGGWRSVAFLSFTLFLHLLASLTGHIRLAYTYVFISPNLSRSYLSDWWIIMGVRVML